MRAFTLFWLLLLTGCDSFQREGPRGDCIGTGGPSVLVEVRREDGEPAAIGSTIVIRDGAFSDSGGAWDTLHVGAGERRPGHYEVRVTKPGYHPVVLQDVQAPGDTICQYAEPTDIRRVVLRSLPDAPPVRSIVVLPASLLFTGGPGSPVQMRAIVDAAPGISRAVRWRSIDTTVAVVSPTGVLRAQCIASMDSAVITAMSVADPQMRGEAYVYVWPPHDPESLIPESARKPVEECLRKLRGDR